MQQISVCFNKVKKDCLRFIKSQETSTEKFQGKERMLKLFLIPMCFWIAGKIRNKKPELKDNNNNLTNFMVGGSSGFLIFELVHWLIRMKFMLLQKLIIR